MYKPPRKKQLGQDAISTTSLADMMFLLLIFFIMTTSLARVNGIVTDMPAGSKSQQLQSDKNMTLGLHDGQMTLNDQPVTFPQAERTLKSLRLQDRSPEARVVILSSTGSEDYQLYYRAMALIQACGGVVAIESEAEGGGKQ